MSTSHHSQSSPLRSGSSLKEIPPEQKMAAQVDHCETATRPDITAERSSEDEVEPELHARTWLAVAAMVFLNMVQLVALQGPPAVLTYIGSDLGVTSVGRQTWIVNVVTLVLAVLGPAVCSASDVFQARKELLLICCVFPFVGAAIAPGSQSLARILVAQILIGVGFCSTAISFSITSEILPRRWRPFAQACINIGAALGASAGPLIIGALIKQNSHEGWRRFFWIQMAIWGLVTIGIFFGYQPPKRHTGFDHLSWWQKLLKLDLIGSGLFLAGLTTLLVGISLGNSPYPWTSSRVLGPLIVGFLLFIVFGIYEWKGTRTGILHHDLFTPSVSHVRTFSICIASMFVESVLFFCIALFYPILTGVLFESDPFLQTVRVLPFWVCTALSTVAYGYFASRFRTIRSPLIAGYVILTAALIGLSTIQPSGSRNAVIFQGLAGLGFGAPLILLIAGVQLAVPHHLIATATAVALSARALGSTVFNAINTAAVNDRLARYIPDYVSKATVAAGLPPASIGPFLQALGTHYPEALLQVHGVTPEIIGAGLSAFRQAYADGLRIVFIIAAPFGVVACVLALLLGDLTKTMNWHVDAPLEKVKVEEKIELRADA